MAMIIELSRGAEPVQDDTDNDNEHRPPAEVILFPGVRYERWNDRPTETTRPNSLFGARLRSGVQRDWLDI